MHSGPGRRTAKKKPAWPARGTRRERQGHDLIFFWRAAKKKTCMAETGPQSTGADQSPAGCQKSKITMISVFVCFIKGDGELMDFMEIPLYVSNRSLPEIDENPTPEDRIFVDFWEAPVGNVKGELGSGRPVDRSRTQRLQKKIKS